jgi:hypothetical protein
MLRLQKVKDNAARLMTHNDSIRFQEVELQDPVNGFRSKVLDLHLLIRYMTEYLAAVEGFMNALFGVATSARRVIEISANDRVRKQRWQRQRQAVDEIQTEILPEHVSEKGPCCSAFVRLADA